MGINLSNVRSRFYSLIIVFLTAIAVVFLNLPAATSTPPNTLRSIIYQARDCWIEEKADIFASLFTSDGEVIVPGHRWVGQSEIQEAAANFAAYASEVKIEIQQIVIEGNHAVVEWHWQETEKATGQRKKADDAIVIDFAAGGRIKRWREYIDTQTPSILFNNNHQKNGSETPS